MGKRPTVHVSRLVSFGLSPSEMKTFAGAATKGFPNLVKRFLTKGIISIPLFIAAYLVRKQIKAENLRIYRKEGMAEAAALEAAALEASQSN